MAHDENRHASTWGTAPAVRARRSSFHTTKVSPERMSSSAAFSSGRSWRAPLAVSSKTFSQPSSRSHPGRQRVDLAGKFSQPVAQGSIGRNSQPAASGTIHQAFAHHAFDRGPFGGG